MAVSIEQQQHDDHVGRYVDEMLGYPWLARRTWFERTEFERFDYGPFEKTHYHDDGLWPEN